jgi:hypothetical protein
MDDSSILERIELEEREAPFCSCGARTVPVARDGVLRLECSSLTPRKPLLTRLLTLQFEVGHTRRPILADAALFGSYPSPAASRS